MNHIDEWMSSLNGGKMWIWTAIAALAMVLLAIVINKMTKNNS